MNTKKKILSLIGSACACSAFAVPVVSNVQMSQTGGKTVTITYELSEPAVVTLDIETNFVGEAGTGWASIGGQHVQRFSADSDVWKKCEGKSTYTIRWRPDLSWTGNKIADGGARAVVSAWSLDNTPDYMVVDITAGAKPNTQRYYPSVDFLPGGLFGNDDYRTSLLVMRKIMAKDVLWTMGNGTSSHQVQLDSNYYIGVFPVTQSQFERITGYNNSVFNNAAAKAMRPVDTVCYNDIRLSDGTNQYDTQTAYMWPNDPNPKSFLGLLRTKTGLDFDLPADAQWEFACRAGHGEGRLGDGSSEDAVGALARMARYRENSNSAEAEGTINQTWVKYPNYDENRGTAIVGTYAPNSWGLYDMHGNIAEWCLDFHASDIKDLNGAINIDPNDCTKPLSGTSDKRVLRYGSWCGYASQCSASFRYGESSGQRFTFYGFRVACTAGLQ